MPKAKKDLKKKKILLNKGAFKEYTIYRACSLQKNPWGGGPHPSKNKNKTKQKSKKGKKVEKDVKIEKELKTEKERNGEGRKQGTHQDREKKLKKKR